MAHSVKPLSEEIKASMESSNKRTLAKAPSSKLPSLESKSMFSDCAYATEHLHLLPFLLLQKHSENYGIAHKAQNIITKGHYTYQLLMKAESTWLNHVPCT
jgi:hypothetical protein